MLRKIAKYSALTSAIIILTCSIFSAEHGINGSFESLYPVPFHKTMTGKVTIIAASAIICAAITYATLGTGTGAAAGPLVTWVGTTVGEIAGYSGIAATNYGLAFFGGGALVDGGLGIAGGIAILNGLGDATLSFALECVPSPDKEYQKYSLVKLPLPECPNNCAVSIINDMGHLKGKFDNNTSGTFNPSDFRRIYERYYRQAIAIMKSAESDPCQLTMLAIMQYNLIQYDDAAMTLDKVYPYLNTPSVYHYLYALIDLGRNNYTSAEAHCLHAIRTEPSAIRPYLLLSQLLLDTGRYMGSHKIVQQGLENSDGNNFALLQTGGNLCYYHLKNFTKAKEYYLKALSNVNIPEIEAECNLMLARCSKKLGKMLDAEQYIREANSKVEHNDLYRNLINRNWMKRD